MPHIHQVAIVPYSAEQMFELVNAIHDYPKFLKGCIAASAVNLTPELVQGSLTLKKMGLEYSFTTLNTLAYPSRITLQLEKGLFKSLEGTWNFTPLSHGCEVSFELDFEFENVLAGAALNPFVASLFDDIVHSFCQRARNVYS